MSSRAFLWVEKIGLCYGAANKAASPVFSDVSFGVERGEFVSMIGHSGCGKSSILSIVAGLLQPTSGYVFVAGKQVTAPGLGRGVIFQNHSLLPWKTCLGNVMFSVRAKHRTWTQAQVREHSLKYLEMVGLRDVSDRRPAQLSGGMRQRVGIARAFAIEPQILLMDEPFGALDALTRGTIQDELIGICARTGQTVFMITHDVDEAIYLSDRVLLMSNGPDAHIAGQVPITLERPRARAELSKSPQFYGLRSQLLDFLQQHARRSTLGAQSSDSKGEQPQPVGLVETQ